MALSNKSFDELSEQDLIEQKDTGIPEGVLVDYKRDIYGRADGDVKEFLKDVSSFANTAGGHLIIGMDEAGGIPTALVPLSGNPDQDLQRLESYVRDGLEPRIPGVRMKALPITGGGYAIVVRIPKSYNPPHRVSARNTNRIYGRNSAGAYEYSVDELRVVFNSAASALDRVRAFRAERLAKIEAGEAIVPLAVNRGYLIVHLVPLSAFGVGGRIDPGQGFSVQQLLHPLGFSGYSPSINFDGFTNTYQGKDGRCWSYTHIFRNGAIEGVKVRVISDSHAIPTLDLDQWIFGALAPYLSALQKLEVAPPIALMITLQGVRGARLGVPPEWTASPPAIERSVLELPEILIEQYGTELDYQRAARPAFDALWNAGGFAKSAHFDDTGRWDPNSWRKRTRR